MTEAESETSQESTRTPFQARRAPWDGEPLLGVSESPESGPHHENRAVPQGKLP